MMNYIVVASLLLVAGASAEQPQEVSNVQTVPVPVQSQPSHVVGHTSAVESTGPQPAVGVHHGGQHFPGAGPVVSFEQPAVPHYYSPAGMMQVVGQSQAEQQQQQYPGAKPATVRHYAAAGPAEQYGQPESASIPPNYKPFGSWGLYIGGNPADGYYSNYYKALTGSVASPDKPSSNGEPVKPVVGSQSFVGQASGFSGGSPMLKQGPVYPQSVAYQDQAYPYGGEYYTPADLNSGSRLQVSNQVVVPSAYTSTSSGSGSGSGAFGSPAEQYQPAAMYYAADTYSAAGTKKTAPAAFAQKEVQAPLSPAKGYHQQQRMGYAYAAGPQAVAYQSPVTVHQASYQQNAPAAAPQVVAYPVPVGSQLVGSQPGVEGAFQPYGVHGFTRYAVKPTAVVTTEQTYYPAGVHAAPASQFPVYKQQQQQQHFVSYAQPLGFYGYPLSQLHYSSGAVAPAFGAQSAHGAAAAAAAAAGVGPASGPAPVPAAAVPQPPAPQGAAVVEHASPVAPVEAASSEKSETNSEANKQQAQPQAQKRA